ncbi:MAG: MXAN_5187 family protein [Kofleriaceae bacterium]
MFLSKIWFFLVALAAAIALTIALVMPRPAQRQLVDEEHARLTTACSVIDILLADAARDRLMFATTFARANEVVGALDAASQAKEIDASRMKQVREPAGKLLAGAKGGQPPDFAILVDKKGRVVTRLKLDEDDFGDVLAGRPIVDDALAGYLRDDLWTQNGTMYFVSAVPVIKTNPPIDYVGAVVIGHKVTNDLAADLSHKLSAIDTQVAFYLGNDDVAASKPLALDHKPMLAALKDLTGGDVSRDCEANKPLAVTAGSDAYTAMISRLPGEARLRGAYYAVFAKTAQARGFSGTLDAVRKSDVSTKILIVVGLVFLLVLALGIGFMWIESDRPLRALQTDAVKLAKSEAERLAEDAHGGKYGSIARSVNIHIDKLGRDAKSARTNLDQLLGPAPEGSLGTIDLLAGARPAARPGGPIASAAPPPSDFKFHDPAPAMMTPPPRAATPAPAPVQQRPSAPVRMTPPPAPAATPPRGVAPAPPAQPSHNSTQPLSLDDDILGGIPGGGTEPDATSYFKQVYEQFVSVKKSCGENTAGLTYQKFAEKLVKNRDDLMSKTGCREVRFTVYVKDGKAALKATPVKDD